MPMRAWTRWCLLLVALAPPAAAQEEVRPPAGTIELRRFEEERIEAWKRDAAHDYDRDLRRAPSIWERAKELLRRWLRTVLGNRLADGVVSNLVYLLIVASIVFALVMLSRGGLRSVFHGAPRSAGEVEPTGEDIRQLDLAALIREAEASGDLRRAIRLHYLLVLRTLVDQGTIDWSPERTDRDYLRQIRDPVLRERFAFTARVFQWVWYGGAEVAPDRYAVLREPFVRFEQASAR
jgi:hypothetical protein